MVQTDRNATRDDWRDDPLAPVPGDGDGRSQGDWTRTLREGWRVWLSAAVLAAIAGYGASFALTPRFTSTTTFIPPRQQSAVSTALAALGPLAQFAGGQGRTSAEEYVALMQSVTVGDRIVDRFGLMAQYHARFHQDARRKLAARVVMNVGKKDGLISVSVQDEDPAKAAAIANQYVEELRRMTSTFALSEAQQRRVFFERQMQDTKDKLVSAQLALQGTGLTAGAVNTEPRAAADAFAEIRAQAIASEVRLQTLRSSLSEGAPAVRAEATRLQALHAQLDKLSAGNRNADSDPDYVGRYREFKYQETLFDAMSRQYELARVDESREGALIQVVDPGRPAERRSSPRRAVVGLMAAVGGAVLAALWLLSRRPRSAA